MQIIEPQPVAETYAEARDLTRSRAPGSVRDGYVDLILDLHEANPFTVFGTHTVAFNRPKTFLLPSGKRCALPASAGGNIHDEQLTKGYRKWVNVVSDRLYGRHWERRGQWLQSVVAWELQKRGVWHLHTMMRGPLVDELLRSPVHSWARDLWWQMFGTCKLLPIDSIGGVSGYLSKYVTKGGQVDFEPVRAWDAGRRVSNQSSLFPTSTKEQAEIFDGVNVGQQGVSASDASQLASRTLSASVVLGYASPQPWHALAPHGHPAP